MNVVLLKVCEPPVISSDYPADMPLSWEEHVKRITDHVKQVSAQYLARVGKRLSGAGLRVRSEVLMGKPGDEIIEYAHKNPPNLIVMATHGYSGLSSWEYGSVADKVLHGVSSPIFLVRPENA
jgi:nucleotide-binding universal stress UspA family protein